MALDTNPTRAETTTLAQGGRRAYFVLAGVGAALAAVYWAALTLLLSYAPGSGSQMLVPLLLIFFYGARAYSVFKGNVQAAQSLLWLHGVGGVMAIVQLVSHPDGVVIALNGIKVLIHVFGVVTAWLARKSYVDAVSATPY